jgi:CDP-paratose 2-epimerase
MARPREVAGRAFNIGGGAQNTVSLVELLDLIAETTGASARVRFEGWRVADQRWYVSDPAAFGEVAGWAPRTDVREGVGRLAAWLADGGVVRGRAPARTEPAESEPPPAEVAT